MIQLTNPSHLAVLRRTLYAAVIVAVLSDGRIHAQPPTAQYQVYTLKHSSAVAVEKSLTEKLAGFGQAAHVVADVKNNQVLVRGPEKCQQAARTLIAALDKPPAGDVEQKPQFIPLLHTPAADVETSLRQRFRERLVPLPELRADCSEYRYASVRGGIVKLTIDRQRNGVTIQGSSTVAKQWGRLIHSLDLPPETDDQTTAIIPLYKADPRKVQAAVEASRAVGGAAPPPSTPRKRPAESPGDRQSRAHRNPAIRLVSYIFQAKDEEGAGMPGDDDESAQPGPQPAEGEKRAAVLDERLRKLRDLGLDVEIETLPDLDAVIIRGRKRDVEEAKRIIQEIERLSAETEPVIELYQLRHVQGEAISDIIRQVQADVLAGHQGRVTILPLGKPNALLLIGWGETVRKAKTFIAQLDQPADPHAQQQVFRLRRAAATTVAQTLSQFFATPFGLEARIQVTPDPRTNSLVVRAAPRDLLEVQMLLEKLDTSETETVFRTRIFKLYNTLANDVYATLQGAIDAARGGGAGAAAGATAGQKSSALELLSIDPQNPQRSQLLRSGILNDVRVTPDPRLNVLVVAAPPESMDLLAALIKELDAPGAVAQIKVFRVVNGDANSMSQMLRLLLPPPTGASGPVLAASEGESSTMGLRFTTDTRTNSIIAIGSSGDLRIVEALVLRLDALDVQSRKTTVVRLKNSPANDVATAVNKFLNSERRVQLAAAGAVSPFQQLESEVVVVPETVSNSLIISATPRFYQEISDLVEKLDSQPAQVMIQVLIAEVTLGSADEFGVELGLQDSVLFDRSVLSGNLATQTSTQQQSTPSGIITQTTQSFPSATLSPGYLFNGAMLGNGANNQQSSGAIGTQGLTGLGLQRSNSELGFGGLVLAASSDAVSILIRSLLESRRMEVLGRPHIMTLDNQPAYIQIGKRVPRITGNMVSTVGVGQMFNSYELVNVGLILGVTPRISPEGKVVMEIDAEKSSVNYTDGQPISTTPSGTGTETTTIRAPAFDTTMAQTTVSAADGETIVLGGLIEKRDENIERKVPYLADIPVLGNLFKYHFDRTQRRELLIILTPHVVRSQEDAEKVKRVESARMHWCLQTVQEIFGDDGLTSAAEVGEIIYPDVNPRGSSRRTGESPRPRRIAVRRGAAVDSTPQPTPAASPRAPDSGPTLAEPIVEPTSEPAPQDSLSQNQRRLGNNVVGAVYNRPDGMPLPSGAATADYQQTLSGRTNSAPGPSRGVAWPAAPAATGPPANAPRWNE